MDLTKELITQLAKEPFDKEEYGNVEDVFFEIIDHVSARNKKTFGKATISEPKTGWIVNKIPRELLLLMSSNLSIEEIVKLGYVNRTFFKALRSDWFWKEMLLRDFGEPTTTDITTNSWKTAFGIEKEGFGKWKEIYAHTYNQINEIIREIRSGEWVEENLPVPGNFVYYDLYNEFKIVFKKIGISNRIKFGHYLINGFWILHLNEQIKLLEEFPGLYENEMIFDFHERNGDKFAFIYFTKSDRPNDEYLIDALANSTDFALRLASFGILSLGKFTQRVRNNTLVVEKFVIADPENIIHAGPAIWTNPTFFVRIMNENPDTYKYLTDDIKTDMEKALKIVEKEKKEEDEMWERLKEEQKRKIAEEIAEEKERIHLENLEKKKLDEEIQKKLDVMRQKRLDREKKKKKQQRKKYGF